MLVEILGTAAGGGFPQWNCTCNNCRSIRLGKFAGKARSHLQVALSPDGIIWFLLNASPDLRSQIEGSVFLHPKGPHRHSPISGLVLTSADLDQAMGALLLREWQPLQIYATASIRKVLREDNSMFAMLERTADQGRWQDIVPGMTFELVSPDGKHSGIQCTPVTVSTRYPGYVDAKRAAKLTPSEAVVGLFVQSPTGKRLGYFPAVGQVNDALLQQLDSVDVLLFDGTFWTEDELIKLERSAQTSQQMGHIPVSSPEGSLDLLSQLKRPRKMFVHINNTNPMLNENGPEHNQVRASGWEIAGDGCHLEL